MEKGTNLCERRAFDVLDGLELLGESFALLAGDGLELVLGKLVESARLLAQVDLGADEQEGRLLAMMQYLGHPLLLDVLVRGRIDHAEAHEEHVRLRIAERPEAVVVLLAGRVEQAECVRLAADHHRHRIVVEHCRHVLAGKLVRRVGYEQTRLADRSVAHYHALDRLHCCADLFASFNWLVLVTRALSSSLSIYNISVYILNNCLDLSLMLADRVAAASIAIFKQQQQQQIKG